MEDTTVPEEEEGVWARAHAHLPGGISPGRDYLVNPSAPYVISAFENGFLTLVKPAGPAEERR